MKVVLGTLKNKGDDLVAFLEPRVGTKPALSGDSIEIDDEGVRQGVKPRHVKTYIKRFLYMNGVRKNYRVFVVGKELTLQEIELGEEEEAKKEKKAPEKAEEAPAQEEKPEAEEEAEPSAPEPPAEAAKVEAAEEKPKPKKAPAKKPKATKKKAAKK